MTPDWRQARAMAQYLLARYVPEPDAEAWRCRQPRLLSMDVELSEADCRTLARLCNLLLVAYVPASEWEDWDRLCPWLLDPEVSRRTPDEKTPALRVA